MSNFRVVREDPNFDWENVDVCGIQPKSTPMISPAEARIPKTVIELKVSKGPNEFLETYYLDGFAINEDGLHFNSRNRSFAFPNWKLDGICLNVKLETNTWQFISLENHFSDTEISKISDWVKNENHVIFLYP